MTYRERRERRAERLRDWADKRGRDAGASLARFDQYRGDIAFNTQPGHIPERARMIRAEDRAFESLSKAAGMRARADGIDAAADRAIYSDDPDAVDRLRDRIADLESQRDRITRYNLSARAAAKNGDTGDASILDDRQRAELESVRRYAPYQLRPGAALPAYALSNLSGNLARQRARLAELER